MKFGVSVTLILLVGTKLKFVLHVASDQFAEKFNCGQKKSKWLIYCDFSHFTCIVLPCERDNLKRFLGILSKFVIHVTNNQFSEKFNNGRLFAIFRI